MPYQLPRCPLVELAPKVNHQVCQNNSHTILLTAHAIQISTIIFYLSVSSPEIYFVFSLFLKLFFNTLRRYKKFEKAPLFNRIFIYNFKVFQALEDYK